jgi:hypothetical protein
VKSSCINVTDQSLTRKTWMPTMPPPIPRLFSPHASFSPLPSSGDRLLPAPPLFGSDASGPFKEHGSLAQNARTKTHHVPRGSDHNVCTLLSRFMLSPIHLHCVGPRGPRPAPGFLTVSACVPMLSLARTSPPAADGPRKGSLCASGRLRPPPPPPLPARSGIDSQHN